MLSILALVHMINTATPISLLINIINSYKCYLSKRARCICLCPCGSSLGKFIFKVFGWVNVHNGLFFLRIDKIRSHIFVILAYLNLALYKDLIFYVHNWQCENSLFQCCGICGTYDEYCTCQLLMVCFVIIALVIIPCGSQRVL